MRDQFWSFFVFSLTMTLYLLLWLNYRSLIPSMKFLRPGELWNSDFRKLTWSIRHILCNTLSGVWGQYPIIKHVNISETAKWLKLTLNGIKVNESRFCSWMILKNKQISFSFQSFLDFGVADIDKAMHLYDFFVASSLSFSSDSFLQFWFFSYALILCPIDLLSSQTQHA